MSRDERKSKQIHPRKLMGKAMRQSFMIFCEGETEVGYFTSFKKRAKSLNGGNALAIVQEAIKQKNAATKKVDQYWVVFDKDDTSDADFESAIKLARENNIEPAWSNQAFELWFILHYNSYTAACHRNNYETILKRQIASYSAAAKSEEQGKELYRITIQHVETGINNAAAGIDFFAANNTALGKMQSSTKVYKLVREILKNS